MHKEKEFIPVVPFITDEVEFLSADREDKFNIAQANTPINEDDEFDTNRISSRFHSDFIMSTADRIDYMDVAPHQIVGISASLIPFLEHDDANRALMGSNMHGSGCSVDCTGIAASFYRNGKLCRYGFGASNCR